MNRLAARLAHAAAGVLVGVMLAACQPRGTAPGLSVHTMPAPQFPVHAGADRRVLVDAAGTPFFVNGDAAWTLLVGATREEADFYLEQRRRQGINTVLVNLLEHKFAKQPPKNAYGDEPFTTPGDFATPNDAYFAHVDRVIGLAAQKGILVLLAPAYAGYKGGDEGWWREMTASGAGKLYTYGQYLGRRYRRFDNIVWVQGGDYDVPDKSLVRAVAAGIRSVDDKPHTYHGQRNTSAMQFWGTQEPWLSVDTIYTDVNNVVASALATHRRTDAPFLLIEARYEGRSASDQLDGQGVRAQAFQAVLSGAAGHVMGHDLVWQLKPGWQQALDSEGARSIAVMKSLFDTLAWWTLVPDAGNTLLAGGAGAGRDRAVAARSGDDALAIVYVPTHRGITIDLSTFAGNRVTARWVDPSTGAMFAARGSPLPKDRALCLRVPARNASGRGDWVLVLQSTP